MPPSRTTETLLKRLKVDELWADFAPPTCSGLNKRKIRKADFIALALEYGLSPEQLQLLDEKVVEKDAEKAVSLETRRKKETERHRQRRAQAVHVRLILP